MQDTLKTLSISLCSSICTALFVVACTAAADKSDTSSDAYPEYEDEEGGSTGGGSGGGVDGGGDDDADDLESITEALAQIAELGTTVAAQQASIAALESEVATLYDNTFRWETFEGACTLGDATDVTVDIEPGGLFHVRYSKYGGGVWAGSGNGTLDEDVTSVEGRCYRSDSSVVRWRWRVAYEW